jgi:hypothetical protein
MGQREAAEKTKKQFGLKTFSHTTLGRAMIRLESRIKTFKNTPESEELSYNTVKPNGQSAVTGNDATTNPSGYFPAVGSTHQRRAIIITFLTKAAKQDGQLNETAEADQDNQLTQDVLQSSQNYARLPYKGAFFDMCHRIVDHTFKKYRCLLL